MNAADRYLWTFDRTTGAPIGIIDTAHTPAPLPGGGLHTPSMGRMPGPAVRIHPKALLLLVAFALVVGLYGGVLLFGHRSTQRPEVVVCPARTEQVAARPIECGPSASGAVAR